MQNRIKEMIQKKGLVQAELARQIGMSVVGMSQLVNPKKMPKLQTFEKIAQVLGVPSWRLFLTDEEQQEIAGNVRERISADKIKEIRRQMRDEIKSEISFNSQIEKARLVCPNCSTTLEVTATVSKPRRGRHPKSAADVEGAEVKE